MRAKSEERLEAERLRREEGLSYNEIAARTGISKSTLSYWLRDIPLKPEHEARLKERLRANRATFAARAWSVNQERYARAREAAYRGGVDVVAMLPDEVAVDELAFAMLYLGEGAKTANRVEVSSTSPEILRYTLWVLREVYKVNETRVTCHLHLVVAAEHLEEQLIKWWMQRLDISRERFRKTTYDRRSRGVELTDDYHGVCSIRYLDTYLQQRILGLAQAYLASRPGEGEGQTNAR